MKLNVDKDITLMDFLLEKQYKRNTIKTLLRYENIFVNGKVETYYAFQLSKGDVVEIEKKKDTAPLEIIYEDKDILVINKPCGLLTEATNKEKEKTAYYIMKEYVNKKKEKLFLVHRLDQYTSGILMFVKNKNLYDALTSTWNEDVKERGYIAIVEGNMKQKNGTIKNYLSESKTQEVYISSKKEGKLAITHYRTIKSNRRYSMLEVHLDTGRKNQIRVHLSSLHHPIAGDKKYGSTSNPIKRLALHHHRFAFVNPLTKRRYELTCKTPEEFDQLFIRKK
jgi:23S rRNA pseudouridine1911/1915/1917 synthase